MTLTAYCFETACLEGFLGGYSGQRATGYLFSKAELVWVALGRFFFPFFKLSPSVYQTEAKRIVFLLLLH